MTEALILIDLQNDYFPGGRMELEGSIEAGPQPSGPALVCLFRLQILRRSDYGWHPPNGIPPPTSNW